MKFISKLTTAFVVLAASIGIAAGGESDSQGSDTPKPKHHSKKKHQAKKKAAAAEEKKSSEDKPAPAADDKAPAPTGAQADPQKSAPESGGGW
jgi:hypothetical protein